MLNEKPNWNFKKKQEKKKIKEEEAKLEDLISINENETIKRETGNSLLVIGTEGLLLFER
jgi:hypothetical protein